MLTTVRIASGRSCSGPFGTPLLERGDKIGRAVGRDFLFPLSCAGVGYTIAGAMPRHELDALVRDVLHQRVVVRPFP